MQPLNPPGVPELSAIPWHTLPPKEALDRLGSQPEGLDPDEAGRRLATFGPNRLRRHRPTSAFTILAGQFTSVVVLLLVAAAVVALLLGDTLESAAIAVVLTINAAIGFVVELRARRAMEALVRYETDTARVVREGTERRIPAEELVPGDVIALSAGDAVPADARLIQVAEVRAIEAPLTGESMPASKWLEPSPHPDTPVAERDAMVHAGTVIAVGEARAVVVATGPATVIGHIGELVAGVEEERTPLERRMNALGQRLVWLALGIATVVALVGVARGVAVELMLETGIALAIAAVPEGLPAVATVALAAGLRRMARRNALVRRLTAVEALGSTTVVCTDKTGTLTAGEMTVTMVETLDDTIHTTGVGYRSGGGFTRDDDVVDPADDDVLGAVLRVALLASRSEVDMESGTATGDPTDAALVVAARKGGYQREALLEDFPADGEIPFSSERRISASFHRRPSGRYAAVKGALPDLLALCGSGRRRDGDVALSEALRETLLERNRQLAEDGLRVIAVAEGSAEPGIDDLPENLTFLALIGILDPPADGVQETVEQLRDAGIRVVMITGDQEGTALAVGRSLGIAGSDMEAVDGLALARMDSEELARAVAETAIFCRVDPEQKLRLVSAFRESGEIVAMLGDGVNDAAALKKADVGVAMGGRGTDVARETASVVLQDDRFQTIAIAVREGRVVFENIRKFVFYLFSCNVAEVFVLLAGAVSGLPLPLLPLQILWLNLVTDTFPALALAFEPGEDAIMQRPPRPADATILSRPFLRSLMFFAALIAGSTLIAFTWGLLTGSLERAVTLSFVTLALAQLFHLGNARSRHAVLRRSDVVSNPWALGAVPLVFGLQIAAVHWPPLARVLGTVPLTLAEWAGVIALSVIPALVGQGAELLQTRGGGNPREDRLPTGQGAA